MVSVVDTQTTSPGGEELELKMSCNVFAAIAAFDAVEAGDVKAYRRAKRTALRLLPDPLDQLALGDSIIAAHKRAHGGVK